MSNERSDNEGSRLVSDAYREMASERAPEHLNQAILRQAAAGRTPAFLGRFSSAAWMKPLAWTVTIALSLAIVLELSEIQTVTAPEPATSNLTPASNPAIPPGASELPDTADTARDPIGTDRREIRRDDAVASPSAPTHNDKVNLAAPAPSQEFTKIQPSALPDARERAQSIAVPMSQKATAAAAGCDEATRESPDAWKECIQSLRDAGRIDLADREYEAFEARYPSE
jgi:hypothetical protein